MMVAKSFKPLAPASSIANT